MRKVMSRSVLPVLATLVLIMCGSGTASAESRDWIGASPVVYVSETTQSFSSGNPLGTFSGLIEAFALDVHSGVLRPIPGSPFSTKYSTGGDMALAPHRAFAYVLAQQYPAGTSFGPTSLLVYALEGRSGTPVFKQALATSASEDSTISVHPSGKFIYVTDCVDSSGNSGVGIFSVHQDGTVVFTGLAQARNDGAATITQNGTFLYTNSDGPPVGNWGNSSCGPIESNIWAFRINSGTGALTPVAGSPFVFQRQICMIGTAPQYLTKQVDPAGKRLFVVDSGNATVTVFAIDELTGALTLLPGDSTDKSVAGFYSSIVDHPLGRFLYIGSIVYSFTGFSLKDDTAASGILPLLPRMPVQVTPVTPADEGSSTMAIDTTGAFLFSNENGYTSAFSCCGSDSLVEFRINPITGELTQLPSTPITLAGTASKIVAH